MAEPLKPTLGRLERVDLRAAWQGEASDFTPWLARAENIALLGEAIGIELEVQSQEAQVGPFRADILCRDAVTNRYVLIENQLERTDHVHLGQLLTYAAGLDAVTIVWVAARFTDEHRAALDWLNRSTASGIDFFGIEVELWRIGTSAMAPKFNIVSQPNDWTTVVKERAAAGSGELTETKRLHLEFWTQFQAYLEEHGSAVRLRRPTTQGLISVSVGRSAFTVVAWNFMTPDRPGATVDGRPHHSGVYLRLSGPDAPAHFDLLRRRYGEQVEARLSPLAKVRWHDGSASGSISVALSTESTPWDPTSWPKLDAWMAAVLEAMDELFRPIVKALDASEYVAAAEGMAPTGEGAAVTPSSEAEEPS